MQAHPESIAVQSWGCVALQNLACGDEAKRTAVVALGGLGMAVPLAVDPSSALRLQLQLGWRIH